MKLETYRGVLESMARNKKRTFHLLLGNGFSMAYDAGIFSYNALHDFVSRIKDEDLSSILRVIETRNFEVIMQYLDTFAVLLDELGAEEAFKRRIETAGAKLKSSLLNAVTALHPEHVFEVPETQSRVCSEFLGTYLGAGGSVFSTNYDLLLYWVLLRNDVDGHVDGCGRELLDPDVPEEEREWSELIWGKHRKAQNVFYLHGALPFFDAGATVIKEQYDTHHYLLRKISNRMEAGEYPIFVAAGDGTQKLDHIRHNQFLNHAYDRFCEIEGSLVTFGFNFGSSDLHMVDAINRAAKYGQKADSRLWSIYIGVYSDEDRAHIEEIEGKFKCKVHIFDAKTAPVWASPGDA